MVAVLARMDDWRLDAFRLVSNTLSLSLSLTHTHTHTPRVQVLNVLARVDDWQFDAFHLSEVSNGRPLSLLSFALLKRSEVVEKFQLNEHRLVKFLMKIEDG